MEKCYLHLGVVAIEKGPFGSSSTKVANFTYFFLLTKWYKAESVLENETHKILWDFQTQTDHLIPTKRPDFALINKRPDSVLINKKELLVFKWILPSRGTTEWKQKKMKR